MTPEHQDTLRKLNLSDTDIDSVCQTLAARFGKALSAEQRVAVNTLLPKQPPLPHAIGPISVRAGIHQLIDSLCSTPPSTPPSARSPGQ